MFLNLSLAFLHLSNIYGSPLFQSSSSQKSTSFLMSNSHFLRSSSHVFADFSGSGFSNVLFVQTKFGQFLKTPIFISMEASPIVKENILFNSTFKETSHDVEIRQCRFVNIISETPGAAIHIDSNQTEFTLTNSFFEVCRCKGKGGAIYAIINHMSSSRNCFHLCRCGKENGNDGSTIYAFSKIGIETEYLTAYECPRYGDQCWYGMIILCNGRLFTHNVNLSHSDVEYIAGLAHFKPDNDQSILRFYSSTNQINGNALAFIDMNFHGTHEYGALVNDSSNTGIFYVQKSVTTLSHFYFLNNTGKITYMCVGDSKANFENCVFSSEFENTGIGFGTQINCLWGQKTATTLDLDFHNCNANLYENQFLNNINIEHYRNTDENKRIVKHAMLLILIIGACFVIYAFYWRFSGRRIRFKNRNRLISL